MEFEFYCALCDYILVLPDAKSPPKCRGCGDTMFFKRTVPLLPSLDSLPSVEEIEEMIQDTPFQASTLDQIIGGTKGLGGPCPPGHDCDICRAIKQITQEEGKKGTYEDAFFSAKNFQELQHDANKIIGISPCPYHDHCKICLNAKPLSVLSPKNNNKKYEKVLGFEWKAKPKIIKKRLTQNEIDDLYIQMKILEEKLHNSDYIRNQQREKLLCRNCRYLRIHPRARVRTSLLRSVPRKSLGPSAPNFDPPLLLRVPSPPRFDPRLLASL